MHQVSCLQLAFWPRCVSWAEYGSARRCLWRDSSVCDGLSALVVRCCDESELLKYHISPYDGVAVSHPCVPACPSFFWGGWNRRGFPFLWSSRYVFFGAVFGWSLRSNLFHKDIDRPMAHVDVPGCTLSRKPSHDSAADRLAIYNVDQMSMDVMGCRSVSVRIDLYRNVCSPLLPKRLIFWSTWRVASGIFCQVWGNSLKPGASWCRFEPWGSPDHTCVSDNCCRFGPHFQTGTHTLLGPFRTCAIKILNLVQGDFGVLW